MIKKINISANEEIVCPKCAHHFSLSESISRQTIERYESSTSLGLILCKEFVEKHNGRIWVESEVDKGSVFKFTVPYLD